MNKELDPTEAETMSVVEILEWTFGKTGSFCIRQQTADWWSYEFCPGHYVRQYHEEQNILTDRFIGITTVEKRASGPGVTEYFLGRFVPEDHEGVTRDNEWEQVVNATSLLLSSQGGSSKPKPPQGAPNEDGSKQQSEDNNARTIPFTKAGGNGAYYIQEYRKGDICFGEDGTEFAMSGTERAITVRYACHDDLSISVKEDSTCHYIIDVTVPTLCYHPLFKAPVLKKQVVKCLPVAS
eukprot:jgi/Psemu1/302087/fgenesh1_kg.57_\